MTSAHNHHHEHEKHHHHHDHEIDMAYMVNHINATLGMMNVKLHQYHWHVQGPHFFSLHAKFEELYNEVNEMFDAFAERLISIGKRPYSTLEKFREHSFIFEEIYENKLPENEMVENIVSDFQKIREVTMRAIELSAEEDDYVTEDMLVGYKGSLDKTIWMLQAFLGKDAHEGEED